MMIGTILFSLRKNLLILFFFTFFSSFLFSGEIIWEEVGEGLEYAEIKAPQKSDIGDSIIKIVRTDPKKYNLRLITAKESGKEAMPITSWAENFSFDAAINAGMFKTDYRTHVGYMRNFSHINNTKIRDNYSAFIVFNPKKNYMEKVPPFQILESETPKNEPEIKKYETVIQSMRLYDFDGSILWKQREKKWSQAVLGIDKSGRALFIISRSPYSVYDFAGMLKKLPLELKSAVYLDGGPCTSLYLRKKSEIVAVSGSFETGFNENDANAEFKKIPNIISAVKK